MAKRTAATKPSRPSTTDKGGQPFMKIRPLHDRILVERVEEKEQVRGGIIIPDTAKEKPQEGKVVAAGNGKVTEDGKKIRSEEHTSELQSQSNLVCRLLLEKKK